MAKNKKKPVQIKASDVFKNLECNAVGEAEKKVIRALRPLEEKGWIILSNFNWVDLKSSSNNKRGEADVVLLGPLGPLVLEVKGGRIREKNETQVVQINQYGNKDFRTLDPWKQAEKTATALLGAAISFFKERFGGEHTKWGWGFAAVFPDCEVEAVGGVEFGADKLFLDATHFEDGQFAYNVEEIAKEWDRSKNETYISKEMWEQFIHAKWNLELTFTSAAETYRREDVKSSREAIAQMSHYLPKMVCDAPLDRVLYQGGPGTGKTLMLIEQAKKLSTQFDNVLLVCYNEPLRDYLRQSLKDVNCLVVCILELAQNVLAGAGQSIESQKEELKGLAGAEIGAWWDELAPKALEVLTNDDMGICGAVLVDEAQDFNNESWWKLLAKFHSNPDSGKWYVSWDPRQNIYSSGKDSLNEFEKMRSWMPKGLKEWNLSVNFRNSAEIHAELLKCEGSEDKSPFEKHDYSALISKGNCKPNRLANSLKLIFKEAPLKFGISLDNLVIIGPHSLGNSPLKEYGEGLSLDNLNIKSNRDIDYLSHPEGIIPYFTAHRFKGLEAEGVILVGFDKKSEKEKQLYWLALSRAKIMAWEIPLK